MADFYKFISKVSTFEGGYQCFVDDNGNYTGGVKGKGNLVGTNHGIAAPTLSAWLGRTATVSDMKNLSLETAQLIFKKFFWDKIHADEIKFQGIAEFIFDWSLGSAYCFKEINRALNFLYGTKLPTTNIQPFTKVQINLINNASNPQKLLDTLKDYRIAWYERIVQADASQAKFLNSWKSRTMAVYNSWKGKITEVAAYVTSEVTNNPNTAIIVVASTATLFFLGKAIFFPSSKSNK
jgi:lysozyme family protein